MSILITRLLTGEEILGDVTIEDGGQKCVINNPTTIGAMPNSESRRLDIHMSPFLPLAAGKSVTLSMAGVVCQYEPVVEVVNKYNAIFGSGIILPKVSAISSID